MTTVAALADVELEALALKSGCGKLLDGDFRPTELVKVVDFGHPKWGGSNDVQGKLVCVWAQSGGSAVHRLLLLS